MLHVVGDIGVGGVGVVRSPFKFVCHSQQCGIA